MQKSRTNPCEITRRLTVGQRVALAAASLAIQRLPLILRQASNAYDMQSMLVDPSSVGRGTYILAQASHIFNSLSGFRVEAIDNGAFRAETKEHFNTLIAEAIKAHEAEIAEEKAFAASPEGKAFMANLAAKGLPRNGQLTAGANTGPDKNLTSS